MAKLFHLAYNRRFRLIGAMLAFPVATAIAQTAPSPPLDCRAAEYRQFDFWVGSWDVFMATGEKAGENLIEVISDGCALLENWSGRGGVTGKSLNIYDRDDKRWHQTWVDNSGGLLMIAGSAVAKGLMMASENTGTVTSAQQRISWTPNDDGSVRQLWESSSDAGKTWAVQFDGKYVRRR